MKSHFVQNKEKSNKTIETRKALYHFKVINNTNKYKVIRIFVQRKGWLLVKFVLLNGFFRVNC